MIDYLVDTSSDAGALAKMLHLHKSFIERSYSLLRFLQEEVPRSSDLRAIVYGPARNGYGASFGSSREWVQSYLGTGFVSKQYQPVKRPTGTFTPMPPEGLTVRLYQIRWLEKTKETPPVIWIVNCRLHVEQFEPVDFEPYFSAVFSKLERAPDQTTDDSSIEEFVARPNNRLPAMHGTGTFTEIPLVAIRDETVARKLLISPFID